MYTFPSFYEIKTVGGRIIFKLVETTSMLFILKKGKRKIRNGMKNSKRIVSTRVKCSNKFFYAKKNKLIKAKKKKKSSIA